jgi:mRNA-degrading endonuclease toxin of MazEF toxin-antitoxin module
MRRGEAWNYLPVIPRPGISTKRLIVSADALNDASELPVVIGVQIVDYDPESILSPRIGDHGWAVVTTIERCVKSRLTELVGTATDAEMEQVDIALRAALAL